MGVLESQQMAISTISHLFFSSHIFLKKLIFKSWERSKGAGANGFRQERREPWKMHRMS